MSDYVLTTTFYLARLFSRALKQGENYSNLAKVITINILDFDFIELEKFHTVFHFWEDEEKGCLLTDMFEIQFIEMPKFRRFQQKDIKGNALHRWLRFFDKNVPEEELKELVTMDNAIKNVETKLEYLSSDEEAIALYQAREDALREKVSMISAAKIEGKIEGKIEIAKKMLASGLEIEKVAEFTELTIFELEKLQEQRH